MGVATVMINLGVLQTTSRTRGTDEQMINIHIHPSFSQFADVEAKNLHNFLWNVQLHMVLV